PEVNAALAMTIVTVPHGCADVPQVDRVDPPAATNQVFAALAVLANTRKEAVVATTTATGSSARLRRNRRTVGRRSAGLIRPDSSGCGQRARTVMPPAQRSSLLPR